MRFAVILPVAAVMAFPAGASEPETGAASQSAMATAAGSSFVIPFEQAEAVPMTELDQLALTALKEKGIEPAHPCSDAVFLRRVYYDLLGTLPDAAAVRAFLQDDSTLKRERLIDELLAHEDFATFRALKWCDILRVKAEFPINLWPNAVQAYQKWVLDALRNNLPYDQFAREMLTSSGSNFRVPPVNFYRAMQGKDPETIARTAALTFMGTRLETWPEEERAELEKIFSRVAYKPTSEWKEEIVMLDPAAQGPLEARMPDGKRLVVPEGKDPRRAFADWLISAENEWFARALVNRTWAWLFGRGIIHEPDDIRADNPASNPELLAFLEREFVKSGYDMAALYRLILNSRTYQQSSIPRSDHPEAEALFAFYPVRRVEAEVLIDAINKITGGTERYSSMVPEPFTFIPENERSIALADGSITSQFLEMFGRPSRDTGLENERNNNPSDAQSLHLLNSTHIQEKITKSNRLQQLMRRQRQDPERIVEIIYVSILSRRPIEAEKEVALKYMEGGAGQMRNGIHDLVWALINSKEFLYRH